VAFGWSFPKVMVIVALAFFLFGVPLMAWVTVLLERRRRKESGRE
jgi:pilus assembly protein TadC